MIALLVVVGIVGFIVACNQTPIIAPILHDDPDVPVQPSNDVGDANPPQLGSGLWAGTSGTEDQESSGLRQVKDQPRADVDPLNPIEPPNDQIGDLAPPVDNLDWYMDPLPLPSTPQLPLKYDPVVYIPPVYFDPDFPVPTDAERKANDSAGAAPAQTPGYVPPIALPVTPIVQPSDYYLPVPTHDSDPAQYWDPIDQVLVPDENPIENWTAENVGDTECPPSVEIEYQPEYLS